MLKAFAESLFKSRKTPKDLPRFDAVLAPDEPLAVIGDIHGTDLLLDTLLNAISARGDHRLVFVGDYVDRGENSAQVLRRLHGLSQRSTDAVFLAGNHEAMMLAFLDDPETVAKRWLRYGGLQTLASFGIGEISENPTPHQSLAARDALAQALGLELIDWVRHLPTRFQSGNVAVVHAGADPALPIAAQSDEALLWGHPDFETRSRTDGIWVVHGHTIKASVTQDNGRIGVDTGAYANGRLSGALIGPDSFEPISVTWRDTR